MLLLATAAALCLGFLLGWGLCAMLHDADASAQLDARADQARAQEAELKLLLGHLSRLEADLAYERARAGRLDPTDQGGTL